MAGGAGGGAGAGAGGAGGAAAADLPFYEAFTRESLKTDPKIQGFKSAEALAEGYLNLEKRFGIEPNRRLDLPADPKDLDAWKAVWSRLGAPEKPDGYGFQLGEGAEEADKALFGRFLDAAHAASMPPIFAKAPMDFWASEQEKAATAAEAARKEAYDAGMASLKQEWGAAFEQRSRQVGAALLKYGNADLAKALDADGIGNFPSLALAIGRMVERMAEPDGGANLEGGRGADVKLTPAQARAESRKVEAHPGFLDRNHPEHKALVAERTRLLAMAEPVT